jgi:hypothetical protein
LVGRLRGAVNALVVEVNPVPGGLAVGHGRDEG